MASEQVIELSVEETNRVRAELGLSQLRGVPPSRSGRGRSNSQKNEQTGSSRNGSEGSLRKKEGSGEEVVLELSVSETNALRERLGLAPLRVGADAGNTSNIGANGDHHAPAPNQGELRSSEERIEKTRMKRQVEEGIEKKFLHSTLASDSDVLEDGSMGKSSLLSWAQQMRQSKHLRDSEDSGSALQNQRTETREYSDSDLKELRVAHSKQELQGAGSSVVLTLADTEILEVHDQSKRALGLNEEDVALENVNLAEEQRQKDGLREKRQVELGMGRAGGYAGFDDDEFMELGGSQGPSRQARMDGKYRELEGDPKASKKRRGKHQVGFQIGEMLDERDREVESDLFAAQSGKAISLESALVQEKTVSDFMTAEEDEQVNSRKKKSARFKKKKKDKKKKDKKKHLRRNGDSEEEDSLAPRSTSKGTSLLEDLEETAKAQGILLLPRKRRLRDDEDPNEETGHQGSVDDDDAEYARKQKYAIIMEKGNERTRQAFPKVEERKPSITSVQDDDEPDDAFLDAALAKARRLNRLKEMAGKKKQSLLGEEAVLEAVRSTGNEMVMQEEKDDGNNLVFAVDETREFTRALRARQEQTDRGSNKSKSLTAAKSEHANVPIDEVEHSTETKVKTEEDEDPQDMDVELSELAKQVKEEANDSAAVRGGLEGTTGSSVAIGRGLGGVLSILKQTGEITKKGAGREEQRGRAKDERTYEDYEEVDLSKVVQLDERTATEKDRELAKREIKLEYRDKYGRLLTRKEAFRDLSYYFHGYGSGKRKQEKKLQQIAREQAEQRLSSRQASSEGGTLGALKATQKATGKAFIVHKTS